MCARYDTHPQQYRKYETYYKTPVIIDLKSGKVSIREAGGTDPHPADPSSDEPRQVDLKWQDYHMAMAFLFSFSCRDQEIVSQVRVHV